MQKSVDKIEKSARLKSLISALKLTQTGFAEVIGLSKAAISLIVSGHREVTSGLVYRVIAEFPKVNKVWLLTGEGEMFLEASTGAGDMVAEPRTEYATFGAPELHRIIAEQSAEMARLRAELESERKERARLLSVVESLLEVVRK